MNFVSRKLSDHLNKENLIAWATFAAVFALAIATPTAQKSLDQNARNQLANSTSSEVASSDEARPLSESRMDALIPLAQALQQAESRHQ